MKRNAMEIETKQKEMEREGHGQEGNNLEGRGKDPQSESKGNGKKWKRRRPTLLVANCKTSISWAPLAWELNGKEMERRAKSNKRNPHEIEQQENGKKPKGGGRKRNGLVDWKKGNK